VSICIHMCVGSHVHRDQRTTFRNWLSFLPSHRFPESDYSCHLYLLSHLAGCTGWFCVSAWHKLELSQRKALQLGKCLHENQLQGIFSISDQGRRAPCGWDHLWAHSLGFYKRAGWASQGSQTSKVHPSMASASAPAPWPAWVPVLTSFGNEQQCESISWINPFLSNLLLGYDICAGIGTLTKTRTHPMNKYKSLTPLVMPCYVCRQAST
jgi:hypothetical protein